MTDSTSRRTPPSKRRNGQVRPRQDTKDSSRDDRRSPARREPAQISPAVASLLREPETHLVMKADNVGLEELVAALTRIPIPRRRKH
jgi:hypothetical protein